MPCSREYRSPDNPGRLREVKYIKTSYYIEQHSCYAVECTTIATGFTNLLSTIRQAQCAVPCYAVDVKFASSGRSALVLYFSCAMTVTARHF